MPALRPGPVTLAVAGLGLVVLAGVGATALAATEDEGPIIGALVVAWLVTIAGAVGVQAVARRPARRLSREVRALTSERAVREQRVGPIGPFGDEDLSGIARTVNMLTESLRGQLELASRERGRLEQTLAAAADVVVAVDGAATVVYANAAASAVLTVQAPAALGRPLLAVLSDHEVHELVSRALRGAETLFSETRSSEAGSSEARSSEEGSARGAPRPGAPAPGSSGPASSLPQGGALIRRDDRHYQVTARPLTGGGLWAAVLMMHDVTSAHEAEQTRREFVANVSHELRTPLATIAAAAETLELGLDEADSHRFHRIIHQETDKMAQLVEEMLDLARLESGLTQPQRAPMDVCLVARDALERMRPQADRAGLTLSLRGPESAMLTADADLVQRALGNLLHNALKFTPAPGTVTLEVQEETGGEGGVVWLLVHDTGIGLSAEDQGRVFQRFYRADWARRRGEGTGLGLALVRHIAESQGGTVRVKSVLGEGSTFGFSLPRGVA